MLIKPLITEKTVAEANMGKFAFKVQLADTKTDIKKAVEKMFNVRVIKIATSVMPGKSHRTGKKWRYDYKPDWKKAIVQLEKGQRIDLFDVGKEEVNA